MTSITSVNIKQQTQLETSMQRVPVDCQQSCQRSSAAAETPTLTYNDVKIRMQW